MSSKDNLDTQDAKSDISKRTSNSRTSNQSVSSTLALKRAQAEAAKAKLQYVIKEGELRKRRAEIDADLDLLQTHKEIAEATAEIDALETFCETEIKSQINVPSEKSAERTDEYVRQHSKQSEDSLAHVINTDTINQSNPNLDRGPSMNDRHLNLTTQPQPQTHKPDIDELQFSQSTQPINNSSQFQPVLNPNASPYYPPFGSQFYNTSGFPHPPASTDFTKYLLRKDLLLTRLTNFNDEPEGYTSWKSGFLSVARELDVNVREETDLLVKWLGPQSVKHALSLRAANITNPERGLRLIWNRLDERFGSPEMVESALKLRLEKFPKLSNRDNKQLYELSDLLSEIESIKVQDKYRSLLAYFDSSTGVIPIVRKLPYSLQEKWTSYASKYKVQNNVSFPPFFVFVDFIRDVSRTRNDPSFAYDLSNPVNKTEKFITRPPNPRVHVSTKKTEIQTFLSKDTQQPSKLCPIHKLNHSLNDCRGFRTRTLEDRKSFLSENRICFRCCESNQHMAKTCDIDIKCTLCDSNKHPTALHLNKSNFPKSKFTSPESNNGGESDKQAISKCTQICKTPFGGKSCSKNILVRVYPKDHPEISKRMYVILDEQSNVSLGRSQFFNQFNESGESTTYTLSTCNGQATTSGRRATDYVIEALDGTGQIDIPMIIECNNIPNVREEIPTPDIAMHYPHLANLADIIPPLDNNSDILLLVGRDVPSAHHVLNQQTGPQNSPYAQKLKWGWVIVGETCLGKVHKPTFISNKTFVLQNGRPSNFEPCSNTFFVKNSPQQSKLFTNISQHLDSNIFVTTPDDNKAGYSMEDKEFIKIMDEGFTKNSENNWEAPLPFKTPRPRLDNNRPQALKRANTLHNSLKSNPLKKQHFFDFMERILEDGHAELAPDLQPRDECWYLPLFGVYHPKKPGQIRGVFDSSARHNGFCLNDVLLKGPNLTNSLLGVILRFRKYKVALTADIERMFYCFYVQEKHRNYLRFLWYKENDINKELVDYRMKVHVFGNSPSPAVATYGLRKTAEIGRQEFGEDVTDFVTRNFYVDDALVSLPSASETIDLAKRTQNCLASQANIRLHKVVSNNADVVQAFPSSDQGKDIKDLDLGTDDIPLQRSLGLLWDLNTDSFKFQTSLESKPFTRRGVLSTINSIFDPLGFVAPIVIQGKGLLREIMSEPLDWDDPLPSHFEQEWESWKQSLPALHGLQIPRIYSSLNPVTRKIQIFCDASQKAIAAVAYMKSVDIDDHQQFGFVLGKAKLAPSHGHTIPRLELCAAVVAVQLGEIISEDLDINLSSIKYFTDSKVVLGYLNNQTRRFYVYVSNRVDRIRKSSLPEQWNYVSTHLNPADVATRNLPASEMESSAWLLGPSLVSSPDPNECFELCNPDEDQEIRPDITALTTICLQLKGNLGSERFQRFSSWNRLIQAISRLKHISQTYGKQTKCKGWHLCLESSTVELRAKTEHFIISQVQHETYQQEIECILTNKPLPKSSPIRQLSPTLDNEGILRVGGRLNRSNLNIEGKNPIIIPGRNHLALLIVRHYHKSVRHQGRHFTEGAVRQAGFWITSGKRLVSSVCHQCIKCRKLRAASPHQKMADLPEDRLTPAPPFTYVGVDTFGHWNIVSRRTRGGTANSKRWAIMFSCLVTRAIHIEVVEDMSSSAFINALRRFMAIRGKVKQFRSDRGTNFVGATDDLCIEAVNVEDSSVQKHLNDQGAKWLFNSPHSSHMGGSWERMIGVTRRILDSLLSDVAANNLTHDVLVTFMAEISAIVNSRPIIPVSTDSESPFILTPYTLLTQKVDGSFEPLTDTSLREQRDIYRSQWKRVQLLADVFWKRWKNEYIQTLQPRRKWIQAQPNIKTGDVVLLKEKDTHRNEWPIGIVTQAIVSSDHKVRKAVVRVVRGNNVLSYTRPVTEMIYLFSSD